MSEDKNLKLKQRIKELKEIVEPTKPFPGNSAHSALLNIAFELVAGILVGLLIGLLLDNLFASKPLFLIICLIISMIATFKLIWKKYINKNGT